MAAHVHSPAAQTLYSQLLEATAAHDLDLLGSFATGIAIERIVRGNSYLYWQLRDLAGGLRQHYLGPAADGRTRSLRDALTAKKASSRPAIEDLRRLAAAYVAAGGSRHQQGHFRVVDALARAGSFRSGVVLVGSHAFVSIGAALGVSWSGDDAATADVDLCRDEFVTIACDNDLKAVDVPGVLGELDPSFFLVPMLDLRTPPTAVMSRRAGVKVDFLTTGRTPRDTNPKLMPAFGLAAQPLRYMEYLVRHDVQRGLFVGPHAVLINIPDPARFALHKLAVATRRAGGAASIKAAKDRRQAAALVAVLDDVQPGAIANAARAAKVHKDRGLPRDMLAAARMLPEPPRSRVLALLGR